MVQYGHTFQTLNPLAPSSCPSPSLPLQVPLKQGLEMLQIFNRFSASTSILEDFQFYDHRQSALQEQKARRGPPGAHQGHQGPPHHMGGGGGRYGGPHQQQHRGMARHRPQAWDKNVSGSRLVFE